MQTQPVTTGLRQTQPQCGKYHGSPQTVAWHDAGTAGQPSPSSETLAGGQDNVYGPGCHVSVHATVPSHNHTAQTGGDIQLHTAAMGSIHSALTGGYAVPHTPKPACSVQGGVAPTPGLPVQTQPT